MLCVMSACQNPMQDWKQQLTADRFATLLNLRCVERVSRRGFLSGVLPSQAELFLGALSPSARALAERRSLGLEPQSGDWILRERPREVRQVVIKPALTTSGLFFGMFVGQLDVVEYDHNLCRRSVTAGVAAVMEILEVEACGCGSVLLALSFPFGRRGSFALHVALSQNLPRR